MKIQHGATHLLNNAYKEPSLLRIVNGEIFRAGGFGSWIKSNLTIEDEIIQYNLIILHPEYSEGYKDES